MHSPAPTQFRTSPRRVRLELIAIGGLLIALAAAAWFGGRWLATVIASKLPYSVDQQIGQIASEQLLADGEVCTNPVLINAVTGIVDRLSGGVDPSYGPFEVHILEDEQVNAFALPGGYLFVFTGLLEELEHPEELAGILGHELGHVVKRHGISRLAQAIWFRFILAQMFGNVGGIGDQLGASAAGLATLEFGREQERESDRFGLDLMVEVGIWPGEFPDFFDRLPGGNIPDWFLTHPDPNARARTLRARIGALEQPDRAWPLPTLEVLRAPCRVEENK